MNDDEDEDEDLEDEDEDLEDGEDDEAEEPCPFKEGDRVRATGRVTESGDEGDPLAQYPHDQYIHAEFGDVGTVIGVDDGIPTVRFDRKGTASAVGIDEIEALKDAD